MGGGFPPKSKALTARRSSFLHAGCRGHRGGHRARFRLRLDASSLSSGGLSGLKGGLDGVRVVVQGALGMGVGIGLGLGVGVGMTNFILYTTEPGMGDPGSALEEEEEEGEGRMQNGASFGIGKFGKGLVKKFKPSPYRNVTDSLLQLNALTFLLQKLSRGWLSAWGCKHNPAIAGGQLWRLATPSLLHGNLLHLLVNCYSLNHIGQQAESMFGSRRMLAVYVVSGVTGNVYSYFYNRMPAVGSSGAIFGLLGALGYFYFRHRKVLQRQVDEPLRALRNVLVTNLVIGLSSPNIDNWAHVGGLVAGAASVLVLGPNLSIVGTKGSKTDPPILVDRPFLPLFANKPLPLL